MKRLRYILVAVLSLLVIYTGVGVAICHCLTFEVACASCSTSCDSCCSESSRAAASDDCDDEGCAVDVYKVDLIKQSVSLSFSVPSFELFGGLLSAFQAMISRGVAVEIPFMNPPNPVPSRHYLALYSVLLI